MNRTMKGYTEKSSLVMGLNGIKSGKFGYKFKQSYPRTLPASFSLERKLYEILILNLLSRRV